MKIFLTWSTKNAISAVFKRHSLWEVGLFSDQLLWYLKLTGMIVGLGFASCMTVAKEKLTDGDGGLVSSFHHNLSGGRNIWWRINDSQNARSTNLLLTFAFCSFLNISMILCIINAPMKFLLLPQTQFYDFLCNLRFTLIHTYYESYFQALPRVLSWENIISTVFSIALIKRSFH